MQTNFQNSFWAEKTFSELKEAYQIAILAKETFFPDEYLTHYFAYCS
ncbi:MAG: hypothetical protein LBI04_00660 [Treponema sp.]|jgi:hypothetical protein|nr:hypothetical protein [Treponema sp.]